MIKNYQAYFVVFNFPQIRINKVLFYYSINLIDKINLLINISQAFALIYLQMLHFIISRTKRNTLFRMPENKKAETQLQVPAL